MTPRFMIDITLRMRTFFFILISLLTFPVFAKPPRLIVVLVIDQFRADYLTRFESRFMPAMKDGKPGGFQYLKTNGAYFPLAEHSALYSVTCAGHASILTGSLPYQNGITDNDWYDSKTKKKI